MIVDVFNAAIIRGLKITINKKNAKAWEPEYEFKKTIKIKIKNKEFTTTLKVTREDLPERKMYMQYHVAGKLITTKKPDWVYDVLPEYQKRIHVDVDSTSVADQLNLNKNNFKIGSSPIISAMFKEVNRHVFDLLTKNEYIKTQPIEKWEKTTLTKFFEKLFKDPKYAFLNPNARGGQGSGQGSGSGEQPTAQIIKRILYQLPILIKIIQASLVVVHLPWVLYNEQTTSVRDG